MTSHLEKSISLADKITDKADDALSQLEREMIIMKWPADFRALMWRVVAEMARGRAEAARRAEDKS